MNLDHLNYFKTLVELQEQECDCRKIVDYAFDVVSCFGKARAGGLAFL